MKTLVVDYIGVRFLKKIVAAPCNPPAAAGNKGGGARARFIDLRRMAARPSVDCSSPQRSEFANRPANDSGASQFAPRISGYGGRYQRASHAANPM